MSELKYSVYLRKSSESEDRQAPSLESQASSLEKIIKEESLSIVKVYEEACTAKVHGKRKTFYDMTKSIERGTSNAILVWSPNRISRNAVDTGLTIDLLDREKLLEVKTPSQTFTSNPNDKFFFNLLCSQAKLENDNKGVDVKRGLQRKAKMGWQPGVVRLGYLNNTHEEKGSRTISNDPVRFDLVKRMFQMVCQEKHTPARVHRIATKEWGLNHRKGRPFSVTTWYSMLHDSFYYGEFEYPVGSGNVYQGSHEPMINKSQYMKIQKILGRVDKEKPKTHQFLYTGIIKCGECGRSISAENKTKVQKNGNRHHYTYYRCARRYKKQCSQLAVREHVLNDYFIDLVKKLFIPDDIYKWAIKTIREILENSTDQRNRLLNTYRSNLGKCEFRLDGIIDMRANGEISANEFSEKKNKTLNEKEQWSKKIEEHTSDIEKILESLKTARDFTEYATEAFQNPRSLSDLAQTTPV